MIVDMAYRSEKGPVRKKNQDAVLAESTGNMGIFAVADGMGGHSRGEDASAVLVTKLKVWWNNLHKSPESYEIDEISEQCYQVLMQANQDIYLTFSLQNEIGGSTVVVLLVWGASYAVISIGDSHIYHREGRRMTPLTVDDVWENLPEVRNVMPEEEISKSPQYGKLTAAAGVALLPKFQMKILPLKKEELFLLCSDGVYKYCGDKELNRVMCGIAGLHSAETMLKKLEKCVLSHGAGDNYSAVICRTKQKGCFSGNNE